MRLQSSLRLLTSLSPLLLRNRRGHFLTMRQGTKLHFNMEAVFDVGDAGWNRRLVLVIEATLVEVFIVFYTTFFPFV